MNKDMKLRRILALSLLLLSTLTPASLAETAHPGFYQPQENAAMDYDDSESRWSFARSAESEHFLLFWEAGFCENPLNAAPDMRVDTADLLEKAELFYAENVDRLHMADEPLPGGDKLQIYLLYTADWVATGAGYDNRIGALWISPATCQPAGSVIAHEIGHCFQYLTYCQALESGAPDDSRAGFRYGYAENAGNALWEIGAQWQSWQSYPEEMFTDYEMETWFQQYHRALENEYTRYQNYWWFYALTEQYGLDAYSRIWRESAYPEDAYQTFMRLYLANDLNAFYDALYRYASHAVTFDFAAAAPYSAAWQGRYDATLYDVGDGWQRIAYASCPEANGFSAIPLDHQGANRVTVSFRGLQPGSALAADDPGLYYIGDEATPENLTGHTRIYNAVDAAPGWRYGFVAYLTDGTRVYGDSCAAQEGVVSFDIPEGTQYLYFVVLGAPESYQVHVWDNDESTDAQMPFEIRVEWRK